jgi:hypothetical protein
MPEARPSAADVHLRAVHGRVGVPEHRLRIRRIARRQGDADRSGDHELGARDHERLGECGDELFGDPLGDRLGVLLQVGEQQQELVARRARQQVGGAHRLLQPDGEAAEQLVARGEAERVVDELEAVEPEVEQRHAGTGAAGAGEREL